MKSKVLFSTGVFGILLMMAGQLSFSINDSFVKLAVKEISLNSSIFSVIFTRGLITTSLLASYLVIIENKNLINIISIKSFHIRGFYEVLTALFFFYCINFSSHIRSIHTSNDQSIFCNYLCIFIPKRKSRDEKMECSYSGICRCNFCY